MNSNGLRIAIGVNGVHEGGSRLPPQNIEAEEALLSAILIEPACLPAVRGIIPGPQAFFRDNHATVYRQICDMADQGKPIEGITLADELTRRGDLARMGGDEFLWRLLGVAPSAANAAYHAGIVREKWIAREVVADAEARLEDSYSNRYTAAELVARVADRVERIEGLAGDDQAGAAITECVADVPREDVSWLWPGRIARKHLNLIAGDPGLGKSFLTMGIAAAITTGAPWPDAPEVRAEIGSVVLLSAEDSIGDTIRPRLEDAGADLRRIHALTGIKGKNGKPRPFTLRHDLPALEDKVKQLGDVRLVVIDPVSAYLGGADEFRNAEIRDVLTPIAELAKRYDFAALMVTHLNKGSGKAIYRSTGSLAFVAASRMAWLLTKDPNDPARRRLSPAKPNLCPNPTSIAFRLFEGSILWESETFVMDADQALTEEREGTTGRQPGDGKRGPVPVKLRAAMDWVSDRLAAGAERHGETRKAAEDAGFTTNLFYRAVEALNVERLVVDGQKYLRMPLADVPENTNGAPF